MVGSGKKKPRARRQVNWPAEAENTRGQDGVAPLRHKHRAAGLPAPSLVRTGPKFRFHRGLTLGPGQDYQTSGKSGEPASSTPAAGWRSAAIAFQKNRLLQETKQGCAWKSALLSRSGSLNQRRLDGWSRHPLGGDSQTRQQDRALVQVWNDSMRWIFRVNKSLLERHPAPRIRPRDLDQLRLRANLRRCRPGKREIDRVDPRVGLP